MNDYWEVERRRQLKERKRLIIIGILALKTRRYPSSDHSILFYRCLKLLEKPITAPGHSHGEGENRSMLLLQRGQIIIGSVYRLILLIAIHAGQVMQRITDERNIDAADLLRLEYVLNGHRTAALP